MTQFIFEIVTMKTQMKYVNYDYKNKKTTLSKIRTNYQEDDDGNLYMQFYGRPGAGSFINQGYKKLRIDVNSFAYVTPSKTIDVVSKILRRGTDLGESFSMLDMTANYGSDTIGFANVFSKSSIYSVELNKKVYEGLTHNVFQYKNIRDRVYVYNDDSTKFLKYNYDIVYADPPFGSNYGSKETYTLSLGSMSLNDIIEKAKAKYVLLKLPRQKEFDNAGLQKFIKSKNYTYKLYTPNDLYNINHKIHKVNYYLVRKY